MRTVLRRVSAALLLLLLVGSSSVALEEDAASEADEPSALRPHRPPSARGVAEDLVLGSCAAGAAATGVALCMQAGSVVAGGGYLAAGASGLMMALSRRKSRLLKREAGALAAGAKELKQELSMLRASTADMREASGAIVDGLGTLWRSMTGSKERMASSLDRTERLQLLTLMHATTAADSQQPSESEMLAAEDYLLRHFPQRDVQALLLAASRAGAAHNLARGTQSEHAAPESLADPPGYLPQPPQQQPPQEQSPQQEPPQQQPPPQMAACLAFRQTAGCNPRGPREMQFDKACEALIPDGISGYCECGGGINVSAVTCDHPPFTCMEVCASL